MDRFEGFGKSTPLNPRLRNRWVYKRSSWQRKATYNCGLYYRRWSGRWSSLAFSTQTTSKKVKKYDFLPVESAATDEKARKMQKIQNQNDHMEENLQASTSTKNKRKEKSSHQLFVNKSKKDDEVEVKDEKHEEEAGILEDFDYHDNINAESYEKYFENVCKLTLLRSAFPSFLLLSYVSCYCWNLPFWRGRKLKEKGRKKEEEKGVSSPAFIFRRTLHFFVQFRRALTKHLTLRPGQTMKNRILALMDIGYSFAAKCLQKVILLRT